MNGLLFIIFYIFVGCICVKIAKVVFDDLSDSDVSDILLIGCFWIVLLPFAFCIAFVYVTYHIVSKCFDWIVENIEKFRTKNNNVIISMDDRSVMNLKSSDRLKQEIDKRTRLN